jgi:hypothetical protein
MIQVLVIFAGAAVTVFLGVKNLIAGYEGMLSATALVLSAVVTAGASWDAFDDPHWKWIRYRAALTQLFAIRDEFKYRMAGDPPLTQEELREVFDQLQLTVKAVEDDWTTQRVEQTKDRTKGSWVKPAGA